MSSEIIFYDNDGQPVGLGEEVSIQFIVIGASLVKPDDPFPTVRLKLKHSPQGMKFKIDNNQEISTAPACILTK